MTEKCTHCTPPKGLPILPVRYILAPKAKGDKTLLPTWAQSSQTDIFTTKLSDQSQLALRVMNKGYLYVLLQTAPFEDIIWQVYSVDENGGFWRQSNCTTHGPASIKEDSKLIGCTANTHQSSDVAYITIEQPEKYQTAWLAFSPFKWTKDICQQYADLSNDGLSIRNQRMQKIEPAQWVKKQTEKDGIAKATDDNIHQVLGYQTPMQDDDYRYEKMAFFDLEKAQQVTDKGPLSSSDKEQVFLVDMDKFRTRSTHQAWNAAAFITTGNISLSTKMQSNQSSDDHVPMMVALWDSISMVEELQFWINHAYANILKVQDEREREIGLVQWHLAIKNSIESGQATEFIKQLDEKYAQHARLQSGDLVGYFLNTQSPIGTITAGTSRVVGHAMIANNLFPSDKQKATNALFKSMKSHVEQAIQDKLITDDDINTPIYNEQAFITVKDSSIKNLQYEAAYLYQWTMRNTIGGEAILDAQQETLFMPIFKLETIAENQAESLKQQFGIFKQQMINKVNADRPLIEAKKAESIEREWQKYESQIDQDRVKQFKQNYAKFDEAANAYVMLLIHDLIQCVDAREQKQQHPFYWGNHEYLKCSANYANFINELILTLVNEIKAIETINNLAEQISTAGQQAGINELFNNNEMTLITTAREPKTAYLYHLIRQPKLDTANIFWDSIIATKIITAEQQQECLDFIDIALNENNVEADPSVREEVIQYFEQYFKFPNQVQPVDSLTNIVNIPDEVKAALDGGKLDILVDSALDVPGQINDVLDGDAWHSAAVPFKQGLSMLSGHFMALVHYLKSTNTNFNSRYATTLIVAISQGIGVPPNYLRTAFKYFAEFERKILTGLTRSSRYIINLLTTSYQRLALRINQIVSAENVQPQIAQYLLGFQLMSLYKLGAKMISSDEVEGNDILTGISGLMAAATLAFKACQPVKKLAELNRQIQTTICPQQATTLKDKLKKMKQLHMMRMRLGNGIGAIGVVLGMIPALSEQKQSIAAAALKWVNITSSLLSSIDMMIQAFGREGLQQLIKSLVIKSAVRAAIMASVGRVVGFLLNPIVGALVFVLTIIVSLLENNPLQHWFARNRFGIQFYASDRFAAKNLSIHTNFTSYDNYQDELDDLGEIVKTDEYLAKQAREQEKIEKFVEDIKNAPYPTRAYIYS